MGVKSTKDARPVSGYNLRTMSNDLDFHDRELCPDGTCIGIIGKDGRCKVCKKPGRAAGDRTGAGPDGDTAATGSFGMGEHELCPDEACIGIIGPDGRCKECGRPSPRHGLDPRTQGLRTEEDVAEELEAAITKGDLAPSPDDFESRELCPDGACIGLIGPDGRCKECRKPARATA